jgi:ArsR family transcriptional regulator
MVPPASSPKLQVFSRLAEIAKALGQTHRLELIEQLAQGPRSVEVLAARTGLSVANASQHLQLLRRAGLVATRREGKYVVCRLSDPAILDILAALRRVAERNVAEVRQVVATYFNTRDALEPVSRAVLLGRLRNGLVSVLDVRPEDEFALGHLPEAINIPLADLEKRLNDLPRDREVVAYCRGAYCVLSFEAVALLRAHGFTVRRLEDGYPEWKASGMPVEEAA